MSRFRIGEAGSAGDVEGVPAMLLAQQPDTMIDGGVVGPLTIRAASVRGAGHRFDGTPRQDDFCLGSAGPQAEHLVVVVADGVSAGARSHLAARVTVRLGVQLLAEALATAPPDAIDWDALVGTVAGHVLLQARKDQGDDSLDAAAAAQVMASTAAFVIVPVAPDPSGARSCTVVPVGDTSVWVLRAAGTWEPVTAVKNEGQAVATSAVFALPLLPSTPIVPLVATLGRGDALFAVTDGVGDPLGDGGGEVGRALATAWALPPNRYEFAAQVDLARRSHSDDRTAVGIWADLDPAPEDLPAFTAADQPPPAWVDLAVAPPDTAVPDVAPVDGAWTPMPWAPTEWTGTPAPGSGAADDPPAPGTAAPGTATP